MLEISVPSGIEYLSLIDAVCQAFCTWAGLTTEITNQISMAVVEAATNAIVHGNRCMKSKKTRVVLEKQREEILVTVSDEGDGFDPSIIPCPIDECNLLKETGRGIYIMRQVMDDVSFETGEGKGTTVRLRKKIASPAGRILAIDYGKTRIGLALSDELGITASPFGKIESDKIEDVIGKIRQIVDGQSVTEVVVGLPLTLGGKVAEAASSVLSFVRILSKELSVPVVTWDERLTTKQGDQVLRRSGLKAKTRRRVVDSVAAAIFLQAYLDVRNQR
ncbi:MAG: Holliday junction resolvase RuvX [bacterium]